jgi:hypothetical protein
MGLSAGTESSNDSSFGTLTTADMSDNSDNDFSSLGSFASVRFAVTVKTHLIPHHATYTEKERSRYWYSDHEKEKFGAKRERVITRMEAGKPKTEGRPYRGLEAITEEGDARVTAQIDRLLNAVMDEQEGQWTANITSEERIAFINRRIYAISVEEALRAAQKDEQVKQYILLCQMRAFLQMMIEQV